MPPVMKPDKNDKIEQQGQTTGEFGNDPEEKAIPAVSESPPELKP